MITLALYAIGFLVLVAIVVAAFLLYGAAILALSTWLAKRPGRAKRCLYAFCVVTVAALVGAGMVSEGLLMAAVGVFCVILGPLVLAAVDGAEEIEREQP